MTAAPDLVKSRERTKPVIRTKIIAEYYDAGYLLFPLNKDRTPNKGYKWRQRSVVDLRIEPQAMSNLFGVALKPNQYVIDVDHHSGQASATPAEFGEWQRNAFGIDMTDDCKFVVSTGREGLHFYYTLPEGKTLKSRQQLADIAGVELKACGHYVVGAGSDKPDGDEFLKPYTVLKGDPTKVTEMPEAIYNYFKQSEPEDVVVEAWEGTTDDPNQIIQYKNYLRTAPIAVVGLQGDNKTYNVALIGRDYGLSLEVVFELMNDFYNVPDKCFPMWEVMALHKKVENAFSYAKLPAGNTSPNIQFKDFDFGLLNDEAESAQTDSKVLTPKKSDANKDTQGYEWVREDREPVSLEVMHWDEDKLTRIRKATRRNILNFFNAINSPLYQTVQYNEFKERIELRKPSPWLKQNDNPRADDYFEPGLPWQDFHTASLGQWLGDRGMDFDYAKIEQCVKQAARAFKYDPLIDWLTSLVWDGIPRLDRLFVDYAGAEDNAYVRDVGRVTIMSAVNRALVPGCQCDTLTVVEGEQGIFKTKMVRIIGGDYYADVKIDTRNKDTISAMLGHWIIEASEMEFVHRTEANAFKSFATQIADNVRLPYEPRAKLYPRRSIFIGTFNPDGTGYLNDPTGARRFLPVKVTKIDLEALARDRDQIFAEAYARFMDGERPYMFDENILAMAKTEQSERTQIDTWDEEARVWLAEVINGTRPKIDPLTVSSFAKEVLLMESGRITRNDSVRLGSVLKKLGFTNRVVWLGKNIPSVRAWSSPEYDSVPSKKTVEERMSAWTTI